MPNYSTDTSPLIDKQYALKGFSKMFTGPMRNFQRTFFLPFIMGLGNLSQDNVSLRDTWNGVDIGGHNWGGAAANPAQIAQKDGRNRRIFAILLAHIDPRCAIYEEIRESFPDDGISSMRYLEQNGDIPYSPEELAELDNQWNTMTWKYLPKSIPTIEMNEDTIREWGNAVKIYSREFANAKTLRQQYDKFLYGLPPQLAHVMINEREAGIPAADVYPANYPADYANAALRGQANPLAGQVNLTRVIARYSRTWQSMAKAGQIQFNKPKEDKANFVGGKGKGKGKGGKGSFGKGKGGKGSPPFYGGRGNGYQNAGSSAANNRTEKDLCLRCGGLGHYANECGTTCEISKPILDGITYPHIEDRATQRSKYLAKKQAKANSAQEGDEDREASEECEAEEEVDDTNYAGENAEDEYDEYEAQWAAWED